MYFIYIVYDSILGTKGKGKVEKAFMVFQGATIGKGTKCNNNSCTVSTNYTAAFHYKVSISFLRSTL